MPCRHHGEKVKKLIVLTGGPGAGKTAVLEMVQRSLCDHVAILPEAASIVFGGGFPRYATTGGLKACQRAIFHVQSETEKLLAEESGVAVGLCDRGTVDGLAYWPNSDEHFWQEVGSTSERELAKYAAVIHLRTPDLIHGYNHKNELRTESPADAAAIDARIERAWANHPRRFFVESTDDFIEKARRALHIIRQELPVTCGSEVRSDLPPQP